MHRQIIYKLKKKLYNAVTLVPSIGLEPVTATVLVTTSFCNGKLSIETNLHSLVSFSSVSLHY
jgi:hypothetical protein